MFALVPIQKTQNCGYKHDLSQESIEILPKDASLDIKNNLNATLYPQHVLPCASPEEPPRLTTTLQLDCLLCLLLHPSPTSHACLKTQT